MTIILYPWFMGFLKCKFTIFFPFVNIFYIYYSPTIPIHLIIIYLANTPSSAILCF